jgi:hypothetical protein
MVKSDDCGSPTRRDFLHEIVATASLPLVSGHTLANNRATANLDTFDQALEMLAGTGPEYGGGLANHGPMAAEALVTMGRSEAVAPFIEQYKRKLQSHPGTTRPIAVGAWREALGDHLRIGDWSTFFNRELKEASWRSVLNEWAARLAPGVAAAAAHGLIRTAHAVRQLAARENEMRKHEMAEGLAYWAACYQPLPATKDVAVIKLKPSEAIKRVELLPIEQRGGGSIVGGLRRLDNFAPFAKVYGLVDSSMDASRFLSDLTGTTARLYLANSRQRASIAFIHAVTAPSAIRLLLPHVKPEIVPGLLRYGWQTTA